MSKWGLSYKGTEPLYPEEWNYLVDALNELDGRSPSSFNCGLAVFSGDGVTTSFQIAHGLGTVPTLVLLGKGVSGLPDIDYWEADNTYITVYFKSAPSSGTDNVKIWWLAIVK